MTFGNLSADTQGSLLMRDLANFLAFGSWVYTGPRLFKDAKALLKAELLPYDFNLLYRRDFMEALRQDNRSKEAQGYKTSFGCGFRD